MSGEQDLLERKGGTSRGKGARRYCAKGNNYRTFLEKNMELAVEGGK